MSIIRLLLLLFQSAATSEAAESSAAIEERIERAAAYVHDALAGRFRGVHWAVGDPSRLAALRLLPAVLCRPLRAAAIALLLGRTKRVFQRGAEHALPSEHLVVEPHAPRLARIGFVRPNVGAIPPMAELQAMWWVAKLQGLATGPRVPSSPYKLTNCRLSYGVDYGLYMFSLAREIGAAPNLARWIL